MCEAFSGPFSASLPRCVFVLVSLFFGSKASQCLITLYVFPFPGVSGPQCPVLPHYSHPEPWRPSSHFLPGRRLGPQLGRSLVCGAELRADPSPVSPNPRGQNYAFRRESPAGLQRQLPAERDQKHKGDVVKLAEVTRFGLFLLDGMCFLSVLLRN